MDEKGHSIDIWGVPEYKINRYEEMDGMKDWNYNPIEDLSEDYARTTNFNVLLTAFLRMDLWKGLNFEIGGNWQRGNSQYKQIRIVRILLLFVRRTMMRRLYQILRSIIFQMGHLSMNSVISVLIGQYVHNLIFDETLMERNIE